MQSFNQVRNIHPWHLEDGVRTSDLDKGVVNEDVSAVEEDSVSDVDEDSQVRDIMFDIIIFVVHLQSLFYCDNFKVLKYLKDLFQLILIFFLDLVVTLLLLELC